MERCPVCNARYTGKRQCHRCKADIGMLADIEASAAAYLGLSLAAYQDGDYFLMLDHAKRSCSLRKTPEGVWLMACASVLTRHFHMAMRLRDAFLTMEDGQPKTGKAGIS